MCDISGWRFEGQLQFLRRQFLQDGELPFTDVLSEDSVEEALLTNRVCWNERIYSPLVTLWVFLGQVLNADHSCRAAVARLIAHLVSDGSAPCSSETSAYCQARKRLPEKFFSDVARHTGRALDAKADPQWLWKGRRVYTFDGSTVTMPDTVDNQAAYPQNPTQKPGCGFPIARICAVFSLACGAVVDLGICRYAGKGQGELSILRTLWEIFQPGDVVLTDSLMCTWTELLVLKRRGVDSVTQLHVCRRADFRRGQRIAKDDHIVNWPKPRSRSMGMKKDGPLPEFLTVRECRIQVNQPGFRTKSIVVVTTILDADAVTKDDIARLYLARWSAELDLRSLKTEMQMDVLRCKTPELVRKEIWTHILAYNLIRTIIAQAAESNEVEPRTISFKGAMQTLEAFQPVIGLRGSHDASVRATLYQQLLDAIVRHRVADRPGRFEPRKRKKRTRRYPQFNKSRREEKLEMLAKK